MEGVSPILARLQILERTQSDELSRLKAEAAQALMRVQEEHQKVQGQYDTLKAGQHTPPEIPYFRQEVGRQERAGAPLWKVCDFAPHLTDQEKAGLEAALEASGILDAWITPEGRLLDRENREVFLDLSPTQAPTSQTSLHQISPQKPTSHLGEWLTPVPGPVNGETDPKAQTLSRDLLQRIFESIGQNTGVAPDPAFSVWVSLDGSWQNGPLSGRWVEPAAQHIGHSTRELERKRRLLELQNILATLKEQIHFHEAEVQAILSRRKTLNKEVQLLPKYSEIHGFLTDLISERKKRASILDRLAEAQRKLIEATASEEKTRSDRDRDAADLNLTRWVDELAELKDLLQEYRQTLNLLWASFETTAQKRSAAVLALEAFQEAGVELEAANTWWVEVHEKLESAHAQLKVLEKLLENAEALEILERLAQIRSEIKQNGVNSQAAQKSLDELNIEFGATLKQTETLTQTLQEVGTQREEAHTLLKNYVITGLMGVAHADFKNLNLTPEWSMTRGVELARRIEGLLSSTNSEDPAWKRKQSQIHEHIQKLNNELLALGYTPNVTSEEDLVVVTVPLQGKLCSMSHVAEEFHGEIEQRQKILDAREREVLENYLIDEVSAQLHDLLRSAETWVQEVNQELSERPMSTGMKLRFAWRPVEQGPQGLAEVRKLLLRAGGTWSAADRDLISQFLQNQIQTERLKNEKGTWQEHLTGALDYRNWHRFSVERQQDERWVRLTKRTHGTGSGGEKAIALTLPQFAAAAAHYRSADPKAPRLVLLDEAFVGVDKDMRSKSMSLLQVFDLDLVMTSEQEWGCYPTVPGIAIYQLSTRPGIDAVVTSRWVWNGKQKFEAPVGKRRGAGIGASVGNGIGAGARVGIGSRN